MDLDEKCWKCPKRELEQELSPDRLDVEVVHFCNHIDDWLHGGESQNCNYVNK